MNKAGRFYVINGEEVPEKDVKPEVIAALEKKAADAKKAPEDKEKPPPNKLAAN